MSDIHGYKSDLRTLFFYSFFLSKSLKRYSHQLKSLLLKYKSHLMFIDFISRILGAEKVSVSNRLENNAEPSVIVTKDSNRPIPEKYKKDVASLRSKYGDDLKTGFCIILTLQEALSIMPRDRKRVDSYAGLISYLKREQGITLTIKSQKTKL